MKERPIASMMEYLHFLQAMKEQEIVVISEDGLKFAYVKSNIIPSFLFAHRLNKLTSLGA